MPDPRILPLSWQICQLKTPQQAGNKTGKNGTNTGVEVGCKCVLYWLGKLSSEKFITRTDQLSNTNYKPKTKLNKLKRKLIKMAKLKMENTTELTRLNHKVFTLVLRRIEFKKADTKFQILYKHKPGAYSIKFQSKNEEEARNKFNQMAKVMIRIHTDKNDMPIIAEGPEVKKLVWNPNKVL